MHGIVLYGLKQFLKDRYGRATWQAIVEESGVDQELFVPATTYPDEYVDEILSAAAAMTAETASEIEYEFGRYLVSTLVDMYGVHVDRDWEGLELVENVEEYILAALRQKDLGEYAPPGIDAERRGADRVVVTYSSDRRMCDLARGLLDGFADHYGESWSVTEQRCMHDGDDACRLLVERGAPAADSAATEPGDSGRTGISFGHDSHTSR